MAEELILGINAEKARQGSRVYKEASDTIQKESRQTDRAITGAEKKVRKFGQTAEKTGKKTSKASKQIARMAKQFIGLGAAIAGVRTIAQFEETMARVAAVTGTAGEEFDALRDKAREMGAATRFSASEAAEGLLFLSKAGFDAAEAMAALGPALNLALVAGVDLGQSADVLSNIMAQFSIDASEAARVTDILTAVSQKSNVSVLQLAESMKLAGPIAGGFGLSLEETAAAIGVLGNAGIQASLAGTAMRGSLLTLLTPTDEVKKKFIAAGVSAKAFEATQRDLVSIFRELKAGTLDVGAFVDTFGKRFAAAGITISNNVVELEALVKAARNAGGAAKDFADQIDDTLIGSFKSLLAAVDDVLISIGDDGLLGIMRTTIDVLSDVVRAYGGAEAKHKDLELAVDLVVLALDFMIARWVTLKGLALLKLLSGWAVGLRNVALGVTTVGIAMNATPIGLFATAVAAATAAWFAYSRAADKANERQQELNLVLSATNSLLKEAEAFKIPEPSRTLQGVVDRLEARLAQMQRLRKALPGLTDRNDLIDIDALTKLGAPRGNFPAGEKTTFDAALRTIMAIEEVLERTLKSRREDLEIENRITEALEKHRKELAPLQAQPRNKALDELDEMLDKLRKETELLGLTKEAVEDIRLQKELDAKLARITDPVQRAAAMERIKSIKDELSLQKDRTEAMRVQAAFDEEQRNKSRTMEKVIERDLSSLEIELQLVGKIGEERRKDLITQEVLALGFENEKDVSQEILDLLRKRVDLVLKLTAAEKIAAAAASTEAQIRGAIINSMTDLILSLGDASKDSLETVKSLSREIGRIIVRQSLEGLIGSDRGNVFHGGDVVPFANGGLPFGSSIINRPTTFQMPSGRRGIAGENFKKEGILPLERNAQGQLGVIAVGGGGGGTVNQDNRRVTMNMTFIDQARDSRSFQQTETQIVRRMNDRLGRG